MPWTVSPVLSGCRHNLFLVLAAHDALAVGEEAEFRAPDLLHRDTSSGSSTMSISPSGSGGNARLHLMAL
jgi:hypothetical protein